MLQDQTPQPEPAAPQPAAQTPAPCTVTPALLKTHSITDEEYGSILQKLGRTPSLTELGIFSVMWSEHCSYKSSRVHLKRLPTRGTRLAGPGAVVQGPGENAGIIDVGDGWACAFKIESHNHPSYIEPYQGAATGVGGILRDIFTMGARPMAVMDSLRFGPLVEQGLEARGEGLANDVEVSEQPLAGAADAIEAVSTPGPGPSALGSVDFARNRQTLRGVVHGVGGYGNCFGVPNLGGETRFEPCYSGNPLVNAFALGLVRTDEIFYAKAEGVGNPVFYVGAKTGRDGIHGATMASEEFTEGSEQKRPNVQMGDPFLEKLLLEACLEAMRTGAVLGIQDMGAAGLTCSTCEMGARGHLGVTIELDRVPQRETGMSTYEIMLSESQERMLLVAEKGREQEVLDVFAKWGLDCAEVGVVTADDVMRVFHGGVLEAEIPNPALTDEAPVYHRPVGTWNPPVPKDSPAWVLAELNKPRDYTADLLKLLASPNICSKRWVYEQYDSMVQTNTVDGPGGEAGVIRVKGAQDEKPERGIAMALAGNGRWCYLDPKLGAMHAVAEAARKVACTGAVPVAATNCLNFGNPQKPEIMAQLSAAIDGIAEACAALGTPVTGGNVSLYNETLGEGIYPTPVIGIVGLLDDVRKAVPAHFQAAGDSVYFLSSYQGRGRNALADMGATAYAQAMGWPLWGAPPVLDVHEEAALHRALAELAMAGLLHSCSDISDGGFAVAVAKAAMGGGLGFRCGMELRTDHADRLPFLAAERLFSEIPSSVLVTLRPGDEARMREVLKAHPGLWLAPLGEVAAADTFAIALNGEPAIQTTTPELAQGWHSALETTLDDAVFVGAGA